MLWETSRESVSGKQELIIINLFERGIDMSNELGKRYECRECGTEVLCTKLGEGSVNCCETEMSIKQAKSLPTAD